MKKIIIVASVLAAGLALFIVFKGLMPAVPTGTLADGLYAVNDVFVDMFLVKKGGTVVCIDAGLSPGSIAKGLRKIGIDPASVDAVFFTHSDRDHVGGAPLFRNAEFYIPEPEIRMVDGSTKRVIFGRERTNKILVPFKALREGVLVSIGGVGILPIWTPGHTPGSTSYLVDGKWLFTGDLLMTKGGRAVLAWKGLNMDNERSLRSARMLAGDLRGVALLLTSHSGVFPDFTKAMVKFR